MSHPFGDRVRQHLHRKHGLSQARLAAGTGQPPFVISLMCKGERLTGRGVRARVLAIIAWLQEQGTLSTRDEAQALLTAAGLPALDPALPDDAQLIQTLQHADPPRMIVAHPEPALPVALSNFVGRKEELATVERLLRANRLVTLTGPGGVGKTRLAMELAAVVRGAFADGVFSVSLAPISDPALVAATIAHALLVRDMGDQPLVETLQMYLQKKRLLLILDNFEHLLLAVPLVAQLLAVAADLTVLVTSRAPLHLPGEQEFPVPPLSLPDLQQPLPLATLSRADAVTLFVARAQAVRPDFQLTEANGSIVAQICAKLDGLPLAIELAAARAKVLPPAALLVRLIERLPGQLQVLTGGARTLPVRQQTLRETIAWSYHLLEPPMQQLFQRLAVFVGGCTVEMVEAVCLENGRPGDALDGLQALADQSLVHCGEVVGGEPRFSLLETIRAYALERLVAGADSDAVYRRHARYCLELAEAAEAQLHGPEQAAWLQRLEQEHANLQAALAWSVTATDGLQTGLRLAGSIWWFWDVRGYWRQGRDWLERLLVQGNQTAIAAAVRAKALYGLGVLVSATDSAAARVLVEESLALFRDLDDRAGMAAARNKLAGLAHDTGDLRAAQTLSEESLGLYRELDDRLGMADALTTLGRLAQEQAWYDRATCCYEEALRLRRQAGSKEAIASALLNLGELARSQGAYARAKPLYEAALAVFRELDDRRGMAGALHNLGEVARWQGDVVRAIGLFRKSLALFYALGETETIAASLSGLAGVVADCGQPEDALLLLGAVEAALEAVGGQLDPADRAAYEQTVASVGARVDQSTSRLLWAEGRSLSLDQAIIYARNLTALQEPASLHSCSEDRTTPSASAGSVESVAPPDAGSGAAELLTRRELEVLHLVAQGLTNAQVAAKLVISPRTVERHLSSIYSKLEVSSRTAATRYATDRDLI